MAHVDETYSVSIGVGTQSGGSITEAVAAIAVIVLTILGLAQVAPSLLVAIATIAAGVGFVVRGSSTASMIARSGVAPSGSSEIGGGFAVEMLIGAAGIILGILALLEVDPTDLVAIAVIAYGAAQVLGGHSNAAAGGSTAAFSNAAGLQALAGLQAIVLGILALAGFSPLVLVLIALLALGSLLFVNGATFGDAVLAMFRR